MKIISVSNYLKNNQSNILNILVFTEKLYCSKCFMNKSAYFSYSIENLGVYSSLKL